VAAAPSPHGGAKGWSSLAGLLTGAGAGTDVEVEDLERWREEVRATLARIDVKRGRLQGQIAAASRGGRRRARPLPVSVRTTRRRFLLRPMATTTTTVRATPPEWRRP